MMTATMQTTCGVACVRTAEYFHRSAQCLDTRKAEMTPEDDSRGNLVKPGKQFKPLPYPAKRCQ